jgi:hypothetical protein
MYFKAKKEKNSRHSIALSLCTFLVMDDYIYLETIILYKR